MRFYADLHLHSKYARATSRDADLAHMALWAARKGVAVVGTGDFTHPRWFAEIREQLVPAEPGLLRLRPDLEKWVNAQWPPAARSPARFILQVEIATIYKKGDRTRKVHHCLYVPDLAAAERLIQRLARIGNLKSDGRPILGLDSRHLLEITLEASEGAFLIPAHIWTPWFAVLGSKSGFDTIEECYADLAPHVFALETGLSSDPPMNWRLSRLDRFRLVSNSDAHSPGKIAREACVFDTAPDYFAMRRALATGEGYDGTVEFFPEEGKYHLDGHRKCEVVLAPAETDQLRGLCPVCGKELTVGVMHRVVELADRPAGARPPTGKPFRSLIPLMEVLGEILRVGAGSRKVAEAYDRLLNQVGPELYLLEQAPLDEIRPTGFPLLAEAISRMRAARVIRQPGYDGEYGVIRLFEEGELARDHATGVLFQLDGATRAQPTAPPPRPPPSAAVPPAGPSRPTAEAVTPVREAPAVFRAGRDDPLAALDPEQRAAAEMGAGPLLIIAGPGTGKTRTLTHRIAHLIRNRGVPAEQCLAVTFTNRAADEMRERLAQLVPSAEAITVATFHGLAHRLLREHGHQLGLPSDFRIAGEAERQTLLAERVKLTERQAGQLLKRISRWKCEGGAVSEAERTTLTTYQEALAEKGWLDFDDLIRRAVELLESRDDLRRPYQERFRWISVDEFQDIDARQYRLIRLLVPSAGNLCVIGDPDQAIYGFRGTDVRFFEQLRADFPALRTIQLRRNYRSGPAIVQGALQAIAPTSLIAERVLEALSRDSTPITIHEAVSDKAEAEFIVHAIENLIGGTTFHALDTGRAADGTGGNFSFADFAVLYRADALADGLAEALTRAGFPFERRSHAPLIEHPAVQSLLTVMRDQPADRSIPERLRAAGSRPERQPWIDLALDRLARHCGSDLARFESELALNLDLDQWDPRADRIKLLTLHASKGLEFPVVFLAGCEDGLLPLRWGPEEDPEEVAEERRLFFVGMTRARQRLFLTHARKRFWRGQVRPQTISPFVAAIQQELLECSRTRPAPPRKKPAGIQMELFG